MQMMNSKIIYPELSYKIYGICFEAHNKLGRLLNEKQYGDAIATLLKEAEIPFIREYPIELEFKNIKIGGTNRVDFFIDGKIILEIKAKHYFTRDDYHQLKRYLQTAHCKLGILVNFREHKLRPKRVLNSSADV